MSRYRIQKRTKYDEVTYHIQKHHSILFGLLSWWQTCIRTEKYFFGELAIFCTQKQAEFYCKKYSSFGS